MCCVYVYVCVCVCVCFWGGDRCEGCVEGVEGGGTDRRKEVVVSGSVDIHELIYLDCPCQLSPLCTCVGGGGGGLVFMSLSTNLFIPNAPAQLSTLCVCGGGGRGGGGAGGTSTYMGKRELARERERERESESERERERERARERDLLLGHNFIMRSVEDKCGDGKLRGFGKIVEFVTN
jgi:hypothetical protein